MVRALILVIHERHTILREACRELYRSTIPLNRLHSAELRSPKPYCPVCVLDLEIHISQWNAVIARALDHELAVLIGQVRIVVDGLDNCDDNTRIPSA